MGVAAIEKAFPKIRKEGYKITSQETSEYNCFAWAMGDTTQWWSPDTNFGYYWPDDVPKTLEVASFVNLYRKAGNYSLCSQAQMEKGFEKIAIYTDANNN